MRFHFNIAQLTTEELLVCFLIQGVQMVGVAKSFAPNGIANSETEEGERSGAVKGVTVDADGCAGDGAGVSVRVCCLDHIVPPLLHKKR
jgi:hypothetical protein